MLDAIETNYNGYRFRSRAEARWAVFFDFLGVEYEYEPEGFNLPSGKRYLPDFRVKCWGLRGKIEDEPFDLWIEVKGVMTREDAFKIWDFVGDDYENPLLIVSSIPNVVWNEQISNSALFRSYDMMNGIEIYPFNYKTIDGDYFAAYPAAHKGKFYLWGDDSNYITNDTEELNKVKNAYICAKRARFEFGENG